MPLLDIRDLHVWYQAKYARIEVLKGLSLTIKNGEAVALLGPSGSGKSTLARTISGLLPPAAVVAGSLTLSGSELYPPTGYPGELMGPVVSYLMQESPAALNPFLTVGSQLAEVLKLRRGLGSKESRCRAVEELGFVGIPEPAEIARRYTHELSGGTRQRVLVALALACDSSLLIVDELTAGLDAHGERLIASLIGERVAGRERALLLITHDDYLARTMCTRTLHMMFGVLEQGLPSSV